VYKNSSTLQAPQHEPGYRVLIVARNRHLHHHYVQSLTEPPSVLGSKYVLLTVTPAMVTRLEAVHQHFDLVVVELDPTSEWEFLAHLHMRYPHSRFLVIVEGQLLPPQGQICEACGALVIPAPASPAVLRSSVACIIHQGRPVSHSRAFIPLQS
jgi:hypothetical protein